MFVEFPAIATLTAVATPGFQFGAWIGCDTPNGTQCTMRMTAPKTVSATFARLHALTVNLAGSGAGSVSSDVAGITCPTDCSETYPEGTVVTLTATPGATIAIFPGTTFTFAGWGGCDAPGPTCQVTMNAARSVTATFDARHQLAVSVSGNGSVNGPGLVCGGGASSSCAGDYAPGTSVTLSALSTAGHRLAGWTGCDAISAAQCTVATTGPRSVAVTFATSTTQPPARGRFSVELRCPHAARSGTVADVVATLSNGTSMARRVTAGAVAVHAGNFNLVGPIKISPPIPAVVLAGTPDAPSSVEHRARVPVPRQATPRTFVTVGMAFFGHVGTSPTRTRLGDGRCVIEVVP